MRIQNSQTGSLKKVGMELIEKTLQVISKLLDHDERKG